MTVLTGSSDPVIDKIDEMLKETLVVVLLDRSGSMTAMAEGAVESLNGLIHDQKMKPDGLRFSLMFFDEVSIDFIYKASPISSVERLRQDQFQPRAGTPLLDATAKAIYHAEGEKTPGEQVMLVIITDGYENMSKEWKRENLFALIQKKEDEGWRFLYLGANQDAWQVSQSMGMAQASSFTFDTATVGGATAMASSSVSSYRSGSYTPQNVDLTEEGEDDDQTGFPKGTPRNLP